MTKKERIYSEADGLVSECTYVTSSLRAKSLVNEIRGFIIQHFGMLDSVQMDKLATASKRAIKVSAKKSTTDVPRKKKKS